MSKNILPLSLLHFLRDGFYTSLFLLLPFAANDLTINLSQIGLLDSLINALGIVIALSVVVLAKKFGGSLLLIVTLLLYSLSFFIFAFSESVLGIVLAVSILGIGLALFSPIASAIVARMTKHKDRGKEIGIFIAFGDVGKAFFPIGVTLFAISLGWKNVSITYAIIALLLFFIFLFFFNKKVPKSEIVPAKIELSYKDLLRHKRTLLAVAASTLDSAATSPLFIFLPFLLLHKQIDPAILGTFVSIFFIGTALSRIVSGRLIDKIGHTQVFILFEVLMVSILILLNQSITTTLLFLLIPILGIVSEGSDAPIQTMLSESADEHESYEKVFAFNTLIRGFGNILGPLLIGGVAGLFGINAAFYVLAGIIGLAILPAAAYQFQK